MTYDTFTKSKQVAYATFRRKHAYHRFNEDALDELHSQAWVDLLQWQRDNHVRVWLAGKLLARAMHFRFIKGLERQKHEKEWHERYLAVEDTRRYNRRVLDDLLDGVPTDTKRVIEMRLQGYNKQEISGSMEISTSTVARRIADFKRVATAA